MTDLKRPAVPRTGTPLDTTGAPSRDLRPAVISPRRRFAAQSREMHGPGVAPVANPGPIWARRYRFRLVATDVVIITLCVLAAFLTRFLGGESESTAIALTYGPLTAVIIATWITALGVNHTRDARVVGIGLAEYRRVVNASVISFGLLAIAFLVLKVDIARAYFMLALPLGVAGLLLSRLLWRKWLVKQRRRGRFTSRAIVAGNRADVEYVVRQVQKQGGSVYHVIGAAVTDEENVNDVVRVGPTEVTVVSDLETVAVAAASLGVDAVIVAGQPTGGGDYLRDLGWELEGTGAELVVASRLTNVAGPRIHFRPVEGLPLMHVELPQYEGGKHLMKRALDVVASAGALLFLLPLMLVIGIMVRLDSEGPVLFRQERVGRGGRPFYMLKFRSMVQTAEDDLVGLLDKNEGAGVLFKMKNDPRVTRVGSFLRKYSLDELPQLWNILRGEMSLVGPRPPLQREVAGYAEHVHRRLYIKPGLTGMWQVNGRSNLDWDESVRLDLYYVENWSLTGDLVILWRTVKVLVNPVGAY